MWESVEGKEEEKSFKTGSEKGNPMISKILCLKESEKYYCLDS